MKKRCFIVGPIGEENSPVRRRVDQWMNLVYKPALSKTHSIIRSDQISAPGLISEQILEHLLDDDLVIIDYTGLNPNVMYEAAVRHLTKKPFIQIISSGDKIPFDTKDLRLVFYDCADLGYPKKLVENIKKVLKDMEDPNYKAPEILKKKFDLERICKDPEEFIKLLKKHLKVDDSPGMRGGEGQFTVSERGGVYIPLGGNNNVNFGLTGSGSQSGNGSIALAGGVSRGLTCPSCGNYMGERSYEGGVVRISLYECPLCHHVFY